MLNSGLIHSTEVLTAIWLQLHTNFHVSSPGLTGKRLTQVRQQLLIRLVTSLGHTTSKGRC